MKLSSLQPSGCWKLEAVVPRRNRLVVAVLLFHDMLRLISPSGLVHPRLVASAVCVVHQGLANSVILYCTVHGTLYLPRRSQMQSGQTVAERPKRRPWGADWRAARSPSEPNLVLEILWTDLGRHWVSGRSPSVQNQARRQRRHGNLTLSRSFRPVPGSR